VIPWGSECCGRSDDTGEGMLEADDDKG